VKPVFLLGCYGCIFHGTGNSAQLCQNFGILGEGFEHPISPLVCHCIYSVHEICKSHAFVYLYGDKLEPCVVPKVELCSLNILSVNGTDNYTVCQCPIQIWTPGTELLHICPQPDLDSRD
jgi:hypothetical protein